ncbi:MAG: hypothetical protein BV459_07355 [Thermoplasmata archaeon M11B2D]|nr:MAG: hypothetical protein BV459_07355 [Thermoplasmata archaeon M11B2D]
MLNTLTDCPRVLNKNTDDIPADAVYIGRPSKFGNPYVIGRDGTRKEVVEKYRMYLLSNQQLVIMAKLELKGKDLVCHCSPQLCHGHVLLAVVNDQ